MLPKLHSWSSAANKTYATCLTSKISFRDAELHPCAQVGKLGVVFDGTLSWEAHVCSDSELSRRCMGVLIGLSHERHWLRLHEQLKIRLQRKNSISKKCASFDINVNGDTGPKLSFPLIESFRWSDGKFRFARKLQGVWKKSLPDKSWIKSAVLCVLISFLLEFISRLWEVLSGEGFSQIDSLYQLWWDFKEMCKKTTKIGSAGSGPLCGGTDRWRSRRFPGDSNLEFDNC